MSEVIDSPIDNEEYKRCKNDFYYFFRKYVLINGEPPIMTRDQFNNLIESWNLNVNKDGTK